MGNSFQLGLAQLGAAQLGNPGPAPVPPPVAVDQVEDGASFYFWTELPMVQAITVQAHSGV